MTVPTPTLEVEADLLRSHRLVLACDEVGRGALAGPVAVGVTAVEEACLRTPIPAGLRDSKLVPPGRRASVSASAAAWVSASAVGWAEAAEIDRIGIVRALGRAAARAIACLGAAADLSGAIVLLDGDRDYITDALRVRLPVVARIKADRDCAGPAAASVIAKVARDARMTRLDPLFPGYGWARNKGYGSAAHRAAIGVQGLSVHHRASWSLGVR